jgi:hypothetical protein
LGLQIGAPILSLSPWLRQFWMVASCHILTLLSMSSVILSSNVNIPSELLKLNHRNFEFLMEQSLAASLSVVSLSPLAAL